MKIFCIGRNYTEHARELNNEVPDEPVIFMKPPTALIKDDRPFYLPDFSNDVHYEAEVVVRIGRNGKHVRPEFAHRYISHFTLGLDLTARDIQKRLKAKGLPWEIAKGFDGSAVLGRMRPVGEVTMPTRFELTKNGEVVQRGDTRNMIFAIDQLIAHISRYVTLQQGDLIYTGTPAGVGPLAIGDVLDGTLDGEPTLHTEIR